MKPITKERLQRVRVLVSGDVMLDRYWFGDVSRISPEAPVPVVRIERNDERLGGAANVARNITALGAQAGVLGVVGADEAADRIDALLQHDSVESHLQRDEGIPTIIKLRVIGRQQQLLRVDFEEAPTERVLRDKLSQFNALIPAHDVVALSDYAKGALENVRTMIKAVRALGKTVLVDPKGDDFARYAGASVLTPNRAELRAVIGRWKTEGELTEKAQNLRRELSLGALLLTRSEEGMSLFADENVMHVPTVAREVFDVSGAGDTVIATLATMLGAGLPIAEAVMLANRAGGIVVGKLGTATVSWEELFAAT